MRQTILKSERGRAVTIETDDQGTTITDEAGTVIAQHGTDRHDEMVARQEQAGWHVTRSGDVRPDAAGEAADANQRPDDAPEPDLGASG
jgi:hypothetical protein